jgi:hypothetical protein
MTTFEYISTTLFALFLLFSSIKFSYLCKELDKRDLEKRKNNILNEEVK